ncbi:divalent cation tolerance protein CutA [Novosphingobium sp. EMRT-2]|uniref:divalent cation tolerance protein CutA n=1 Tax=Novosphingobium sp. EMRT-2 TaxID=2571749 RepID=UPI0010BD245F|nr:divalent cation tolerance protein CutA [Novosphingobium sp. EMRT-2]QCI93851.1 divalent-cation tolerance protein CutA [Novosphingobium sp. EMRT-2]
MADGVALIWSPFASSADAEAAAGTLLDAGLIACANILPGMISLYIWQGERGRGEEVAMLCKTTAAALDAAVAKLAEIHPYACPAILGWRADAAPPATLAWLVAETGKNA